MLSKPEYKASLQGQLIGLEKESLRADRGGQIAQTMHPNSLGAALTNPRITTDFSESLLEFITPPLGSVTEVMEELLAQHQFVYKRIGDEMIWATSMPCLLEGEESIRIARYGDSNAGLMKTVYRRGLAWRYGKMMQAIAGVHFNFSYPQFFWQQYQGIVGDTRPLQEFISVSYFSMVRNIQRIGWLVPYLFGASPAICKSFLQGQPTEMSYLGQGTYYDPFGTSLRMGDIGYQNSQEGKTGVKVCYDSLRSYARVLEEATNTHCDTYAKIGVKVNGEYRQLNTNQLQIENEYYATVRPKAVPGKFEKPIAALRRQGVQYIELRSIDVNLFDPLGINESQLYFLQAMMLHSLLKDSPPISCSEAYDGDKNLLQVAHRGRDSELLLIRNEEPVKFNSWAMEIMDEMEGVCECLDNAMDNTVYSEALMQQKEKIKHPSLTPSAKVLASLNDSGQSFFGLAKQYSETHKDWIISQPEDAEKIKSLRQLAEKSLLDQQEIEDGEDQSFDEFLAEYFSS